MIVFALSPKLREQVCTHSSGGRMVDSNAKFGATGPMLGYLYQCRQALLVSIEVSKTFPGLSISIERFDDIAVENADAPIMQLQLKHHLNPGELTDSSSDIWRTLRVWSEQVKANPQLCS